MCGTPASMDSTMSDEPREGRQLSVILAAAACALVLYPLSIGPAAWLLERSGVPYDHWIMQGAEALYWPLEYVTTLTGLDPVVEWYIECFVD